MKGSIIKFNEKEAMCRPTSFFFNTLHQRGKLISEEKELDYGLTKTIQIALHILDKPDLCYPYKLYLTSICLSCEKLFTLVEAPMRGEEVIP